MSTGLSIHTLNIRLDSLPMLLYQKCSKNIELFDAQWISFLPGLFIRDVRKDLCCLEVVVCLPV